MKKVLIITGPTAVGKTKYAISLAKAFNGEIISADSMQVYKGMDIGSAKPDKDELSEARHHLISIVEPFDDFTVAKYQRLAKGCIDAIISRGKLPIIAGGTGLYINSIIYDMDFSETKGNEDLREELENIVLKDGKDALHERLKAVDPSAADRIHPNNIKKVIRAIEVAETRGKGIASFRESFIKNKKYDFIMIGLSQDRKLLYEKINARVDQMMEIGLLSEVKALMEKGLTIDYNSMRGIGYKELIEFLGGSTSLDNAVNLIKQNSRNYAKRQMTWFKRYDDMSWYDVGNGRDFYHLAEEISGYVSTRLSGEL